MEVIQLYPHLSAKKDRRQQNIPVAVERRSGIDRRSKPRLDLDYKLQQDIIQTKDVFDNFRKQESPNATLLSVIPPLDKVEEIQDNLEEKNYTKAVAAGLLLINNFKNDIDKLKQTKNEVKEIIETKKVKQADFQHPASFIRESLLGSSKIGQILHKYDITLFETRPGEHFLKLIGMKEPKQEYFGRKDKLNNQIKAFKTEGNKLAKILGRGFLRIPVLSVLFMGLLESPSIIKEKNHTKQLAKSAISISSIIFSSAILGAIGAYYPPFGLIGTGIGALLGSELAKRLNQRFFPL